MTFYIYYTVGIANYKLDIPLYILLHTKYILLMVDYTHVYLLYFVFIIPSQRHVHYVFFYIYTHLFIFKDSIFHLQGHSL